MSEARTCDGAFGPSGSSVCFPVPGVVHGTFWSAFLEILGDERVGVLVDR